MKRIGIKITFWGTLVTASILMLSFPQGSAPPERSRHRQVEDLPTPGRRIAGHMERRPRRALIAKWLQFTDDGAINAQCRPRNYTAIESQEPVCESGPTEVSSEDVEGTNSPAELKVTRLIGDIMNKVRPKQIIGIIKVEGKEYEFGSGGRGQSIPFGDYPITPEAVGLLGGKHGAIGVANGTIPDPKLHRDRDGIELHAATNDKLETDGCVSIRKDQWPEFRKQVLAIVKEDKKVYLHVSDRGASVSTDPSGFIGETVSEPTFHDVLGLIEGQTAKAPEAPRPTRCCRFMRIKTRHTRPVMRMTHFHPQAGHRRRV